jgi:hypothetical protein
MIRFDWRQCEPPDQREPGWPEPITTILADSYRGAIENDGTWRRLVGALADLPQELGERETRCLEAPDFFLESAPSAVGPSRTLCVFISQQRKDAWKSVRVACLADHHGLDCWLDVHDPTLKLANRLSSGDPRRSVLIAAIIEIALLGSTHVIALHTANSASSTWVPYELGRAKARKIVSTNAAGWFQSGRTPATCGDYVQLAVMTQDESGNANWFRNTAGGQPSVSVPDPCPAHMTRKLR